MSAIQNLIERATGQLRPDPWAKQAVNVSFEETRSGKEQLSGLATQAEHVLELRIYSTFWANKAQLQDERRHAERVIVQLLYDDAIMKLRELRHAVMEGDPSRVFMLCDQLEDLMTWDADDLPPHS